MSVKGEIKKFARWLRAVRDKYFSSPEELREGLANLSEMVSAYELMRGSETTKSIKAKKFLAKMNQGVDIWDALDD
jgi:hypothetical protein